MKNRARHKPLGTVSRRTCRRIRGGWRNAFVRGLNHSWHARGGVENDESFDFTALRITRPPVTTRNEISREEGFFPDVTSSFDPTSRFSSPRA